MVLDENNSHVRNARDGTMIKLDWICLDKQVQFSSGRTPSDQTPSDKFVMLTALCRGEEAEIKNKLRKQN